MKNNLIYVPMIISMAGSVYALPGSIPVTPRSLLRTGASAEYLSPIGSARASFSSAASAPSGFHPVQRASTSGTVPAAVRIVGESPAMAPRSARRADAPLIGSAGEFTAQRKLPFSDLAAMEPLQGPPARPASATDHQHGSVTLISARDVGLSPVRIAAKPVPAPVAAEQVTGPSAGIAENPTSARAVVQDPAAHISAPAAGSLRTATSAANSETVPLLGVNHLGSSSAPLSPKGSQSAGTDNPTITSPLVRTNSIADGNAPPVSPSASQAGLNNAAGDAPPPASGTTDATKKKFLETGLGQFTMFAGVSALAVAPGVIIQAVQGNKGLKQSKEQGDASLDLQKSQAEDAKKANEEAIAAQKAAMEGQFDPSVQGQFDPTTQGQTVTAGDGSQTQEEFPAPIIP